MVGITSLQVGASGRIERLAASVRALRVLLPVSQGGCHARMAAPLLLPAVLYIASAPVSGKPGAACHGRLGSDAQDGIDRDRDARLAAGMGFGAMFQPVGEYQ